MKSNYQPGRTDDLIHTIRIKAAKRFLKDLEKAQMPVYTDSLTIKALEYIAELAKKSRDSNEFEKFSKNER